MGCDMAAINLKWVVTWTKPCRMLHVRDEGSLVGYRLLPMLFVSFCAPSLRAWAADAPPVISAERIKADVTYLASDRLEGRGPGTRGEELTTEYLANEFKKAGLKPLGERGTYLQPVPLVRVVTSPKSTLQATKGNETLDFFAGDEFSGTSQMQTELEQFDAEAVFVGHGITAPEFDWDDYKGIDVKGKVVVLFTNEPPSEDPEILRRQGPHLLRPLDLQVRGGRTSVGSRNTGGWSRTTKPALR